MMQMRPSQHAQACTFSGGFSFPTTEIMTAGLLQIEQSANRATQTTVSPLHRMTAPSLSPSATRTTRSSQRLRPRLPLNYHIPGDDLHTSPSRSRSRSRSASHTRDTASDDVTRQENIREGTPEKTKARGQDASQRQSKRTVGGRKTRGVLEQVEEENVLQENQAVEVKAEDEPEQDAHDRNGGETREECRSQSQTRTGSRVRDAVEMVGNSVNFTFTSAKNALTGVDVHESAMGSENDHGECADRALRHEKAPSDTSSLQKERFNVESLQIKVSPPSQERHFRGSVILRQPFAFLLKRAGAEVVESNGKLLEREIEEKAAPAWLFPVLLIMLLSCILWSRHFVPQLQNEVQPLVLAQGGLKLSPEERSALVDVLNKKIQQKVAILMRDQDDVRKILSDVKDKDAHFDKKLLSLQQSLTEQRTQLASELQAFVSNLRKEYQDHVDNRIVQLTNIVKNEITSRLAEVLDADQDEEAQRLQQLRKEIEQWSYKEFAKLGNVRLNETLMQIGSAVSGFQSMAEEISVLYRFLDKQLDDKIKSMSKEQISAADLQNVEARWQALFTEADGHWKTRQEQTWIELEKLEQANQHILLQKLEDAVQGLRLQTGALLHAQTNDSSELTSLPFLLPFRAHAQALHDILLPHINADIERQLELYTADRVALVDYALGSSGGRIAAASATFEPPVTDANHILDWFVRVHAPTPGPESMLSDAMSVGSCWPCQGSKGAALVELRETIRVGGFTLEHIPLSISPDPSTMPRQVRLMGVPAQHVEIVKARLTSDKPLPVDLPLFSTLGSFTYLREGKSVQYWPVVPVIAAIPTSIVTSFKHVLFIVDSNYGSPNYTCVYRVRVHGQPVKT